MNMMTKTTTPCDMRFRMRGVTLVELMIVVVIVAILASISIPSYRNYVMRAQRTDATSALLRVAAAQEKFYLQNNTYASEAQRAAAPPAGLGIPGTENGWYNLAITSVDLTRDFTVTATPVAGGRQATDTHCATFAVTSTGAKTATYADCW
jgi:type IV pilus assembly protein PilE